MDSPYAMQNMRIGMLGSIRPVAVKSSRPERFPSWALRLARSLCYRRAGLHALRGLAAAAVAAGRRTRRLTAACARPAWRGGTVRGRALGGRRAAVPPDAARAGPPPGPRAAPLPGGGRLRVTAAVSVG